MSVTGMSLNMTSYDYLFLDMLLMGLGVEMVVSIFLLRGDFLVAFFWISVHACGL